MIQAKDIDAAWLGSGNIAGITFMDVNGHGFYEVGINAVTRIEKTVKCGEMSFIPYVSVWVGDEVRAEFSQHRLDGVFFERTT